MTYIQGLKGRTRDLMRGGCLWPLVKDFNGKGSAKPLSSKSLVVRAAFNARGCLPPFVASEALC